MQKLRVGARPNPWFIRGHGIQQLEQQLFDRLVGAQLRTNLRQLGGLHHRGLLLQQGQRAREAIAGCRLPSRFAAGGLQLSRLGRVTAQGLHHHQQRLLDLSTGGQQRAALHAHPHQFLLIRVAQQVEITLHIEYRTLHQRAHLHER